MISKRGEQKYLVQVDAGRDATGKRIRVSEVVNGTKRQAQAREADLRKQMNDEDYVPKTTITTGEWLDKWHATYAPMHQGKRCHIESGGIIRRYLQPALGTVPLQRLTPLLIQKHVTGWSEKYSAKTVRSITGTLSTACKRAVTDGLLKRNPCAFVELPKLQSKPIEYLTEEQVRKLIDVSWGSEYHLPILIAVNTGMRRGEIYGLRWKDVDWERNTLTIEQTVSCPNGKPEIKPAPKTNSSRRTILVPQSVMVALKDQRKVQVEQRLACGRYYQDNDLVIAEPDGKPVSPDRFTAGLPRVGKAAGINNLHPHMLRHTHATLLLANGGTLKEVQSRLGHASAVITQQVYSHVVPEHEAELVERLNGICQRNANT